MRWPAPLPTPSSMNCFAGDDASCTHLTGSLECIVVPQAWPAPSPEGRGGGVRGYKTIESPVPPHPHPLPVGERESRRARGNTVDPNTVQFAITAKPSSPPARPVTSSIPCHQARGG